MSHFSLVFDGYQIYFQNLNFSIESESEKDIVLIMPHNICVSAYKLWALIFELLDIEEQ